MKSFASVYKLLLQHRQAGDYQVLHVLCNLTRLPGLRRRVAELLEADGLSPAKTEIRSCGWLAQVDEYGGSIFHWRPHSRGAADISALVAEAITTLSANENNDGIIQERGRQESAGVGQGGIGEWTR